MTADLGTLRGARVVVLGAAGFLGSHLCDRLVGLGATVTAIDNFITGDPDNVAHLCGQPGFRLVQYDVTDFLHIPGPVDHVLQFASPASPIDYLRWPIQTLKVGSLGTHKALGLARAKGARLLLASTSEVYGDPLVNPQPESYWGNVNPVGPRGVYDEAKRFAEALTLAYYRQHGVEVRIARIFNSILADEQVLYDDGVELRREPVEVLAQRLGGQVDLDGYEVPAFDADGRVRSTPASALIGHRTTQRCFEVRTGYGRSVRVTGDHSLFVEGDDGRPRAQPVTQLAIGDRIAIVGKLRVPERDRTVLDLMDLLVGGSHLDAWDIVVHAPGFGATIRQHRAELLPVLLDRRTRAGRQSGRGTVHGYEATDELPLGAIQRVGLPVPCGPEVTVRKVDSPARLPLVIPVTDELLWLLGVSVAAGRRSDRGTAGAYVTINGEQALLQRARKVVERDLGPHVVASDGPGPAIDIHSPLLVLLLDCLGFVADPVRIPGWVLGLPLPRLKWFLEGYREGHRGHPGLEPGEDVEHGFSTTSDALKDDLIVLLARFGVVASVERHGPTGTQRTGDERSAEWHLTLGRVQPWNPLEWDEGVAQTLRARRTGDLVWAPVRDIVEVEPTEFVYDFSVPGRENFWAGAGISAKNTYGPRMRVNDGRAVPAFFSAALRGQPLPVFGDGSQTRSLCYVDDEVEGLLRLLASDCTGPVNIGNPHEVTILELAETIQDVVGNHPGVEFRPVPEDDPKVRRPDTTLAEQVLGWRAGVSLVDGLARTAPWFRSRLAID